MTQSTGKRRPRGNGSVRERRPGVWELRAPARNDAGQAIQVTRTFRGTRREAEQALRGLLGEIDLGHHKERKRTVDDLLTEWLKLVEAQRAPATYYLYERMVRVHIRPVLGDVTLDRLGPHAIDSFYRGLRAKLDDSSIGLVHKVLRRGLGQGVKWGWLVNNPALRASPPANTDKPIDPPEWERIAELIAVTEQRDETMAMLVFLAALTGLRRGELCGLRWGDVGATTLTVRRRVVPLPGKLLTDGVKTRSSVRTIALADHLVAALGTHRRRMEARAAAAGVTLDPNAWVFSDLVSCSQPLNPNTVSNRFAAARKRVDLSSRLHDLRHFQATWLLGQGVDVKTVSGRLGHRDAHLTLNTYAHWMPALDAAAAAKTEELVLRPRREEAAGPDPREG